MLFIELYIKHQEIFLQIPTLWRLKAKLLTKNINDPLYSGCQMGFS